MLNINELVSIITPVYNSEKYINDTYNSISEQTYESWEWIVIDDLSKDKSIQILREIEKYDSRVKIIENKEKKYASGSRNEGIRVAKGKYMTFIDSDDLWLNNFLEKQLDLIKEKNCKLVYSSYLRKNEALTQNLGNYIVPKTVSYNDLLKTNHLSCLTVLYDRAELNDYYFNEKLTLHEDYVMWLSILKKIKIAYGNSEELAIYRMRSDSSSRNKWKNLLYMLYIFKKVEKLNVIKTFFYLGCYIFYGLKKNKGVIRM